MRRGLHPLPAHIAMAIASYGRTAVPGADFAADLPDDLKGMLRGIRKYQEFPQGDFRAKLEEVWRAGSASLQTIPGHAGDLQHRPAIVLLPSLVNRSYILDLLPERSLLRYFAAQGFAPLLLDWGDTQNDPGQRDLDSVLQERLLPALQHAAKISGGRIHVLGYCMAGTMLAGAALAGIAGVLLVIAIVAIYEFALETKLNEITAPTIMPVLLILILVYDKMTNKGKAELTPDYASHRQDGVESSIRYATNETIGHIGALLSLMTLSLAMGGVIERSEVMGFFPKVFENHWTAMTFLVVTKVILGMIMDPFGAVVLVSGTLAPIAYANNIDPLHFWMMTLVAFELGYLLPPVALNQLLTRQVIGEEEVTEADEEVKHMGFYRRYERWILPLAVITVGLVVVSYGPLLIHDYPGLAFVKDWFPAPAQ